MVSSNIDKLKKFGYKLRRGCRNFWTWYKGIFVGRPWYVKTLSALGSLVAFFIIYLIAVDINFLWLFGKSPSILDIMHPKTYNASYVYSADGQMLCKYYNENRTPVKFEEINENFFNALIDTEDERFRSHHGIDYQGMLGAMKDMVVHHNARGASTITQQLAKNMFKVRTQYSTGLLGKIPGLSIIIMKTKEWILATELEIVFDKDRILTMYANTVDFGNNAYGIKTAARTYYNTTPDSLTVDQCATLVGLLKATSSYNPRSNPKRSMQRRNVVLYNMVTHGHLTQADYDRLKDKPTPLDINIETPNEGKALYYRAAIEQDPMMKKWCEDNNIDFYTDGLRIYTTLDSRLQEHAEQAVRDQMYEIQQRFDYLWGDDPCWIDNEGNVIPHFVEDVAARSKTFEMLKAKFPNNADSVWHYMRTPRKMKIFEYQRRDGHVVAGSKEVTMSPMDSVAHMLHYMHSGLVAMDPRNGFVKAWVGDIDFNTWNYDKVLSMRQPGSTFKLFVYSAAFETGRYNPCSRVVDDVFHKQVYNEVKKVWEDYSPHNANGRFTGRQMTLREAFVQSINSISVRVGDDIGPDKVASTAAAMGIKSPLIPTTSDHAKPSLCLGSMDVNLEELVNAYCTVANYGKHVDPVLVTKIIKVDPDGGETEIYNYNDHQNSEQAISEQTAAQMLTMLQAGLTDAGGTSQPLAEWVQDYGSFYRGGTTDFGGKTGTSNNHSDAWFVGVTPNLVAGAWVGGEYRSIHFLSGSQGQGSRTALPVVGCFLKAVYDDTRLRPEYTARFKHIDLGRELTECDEIYQSSAPVEEVFDDNFDEDRGDGHEQNADSLESQLNPDAPAPPTLEEPVATEPEPQSGRHHNNGGNGGGHNGGGNHNGGNSGGGHKAAATEPKTEKPGK